MESTLQYNHLIKLQLRNIRSFSKKSYSWFQRVDHNSDDVTLKRGATERIHTLILLSTKEVQPLHLSHI